ncbi:hypothetical protein ERW51_02470 [Aliivibrio finisterrensis]|uniref:hypothetical protein n=1 Tax=Aliivibrio finisterrensis TaxID=511998 RepID=UPI0010205CDD|nr:hypothetical protein [Aliivibrio finisterrensis]RYU70397.1 hypothetical protein ERW54_02475 [Aliivibrio finisterrensis]RYU74259.1 hypothetical protein ERW51_02470 [Aliivibrio finisterrensis]RYU76864.1 hypothetical protein ERW48_02485 [Aliivibrio finisterrensis]
MKKRIVFMLVIVAPFMMASMVSANEIVSQKSVESIPFEKNQLSIRLNGDQYQSAFQIDLSDPNLILTIDTELLPQEDLDALLPELGKTDKPTTINEAKSLALRVKAKEKATKGDYAGALVLLNEAEGLTENPAKVLSMKGSVQYKLNQVELAIVSWEKALKLDPSLTEVSDMIKWLEK